MDIISSRILGHDHVLIYDNTTIHRKRRDDALSARKMPKYPTAPNNRMFGVDIPLLDAIGQPAYNTRGKIQRTRIRMGDARFANGLPQPLYYPLGHPRAGVFKGMLEILAERGYERDMLHALRAECHSFKCSPKFERANPCCCRRLLLNEPDFATVLSILEEECAARGFRVIFLPKFHCELNLIEQCWGRAKAIYHDFPASACEDVLEQNATRALAGITLLNIRR
ncbi:unnamed protein product [Peniophora sp. CBMAI 1063]|nr:unnamed protein product [Peniophora sp. CBMAI 1063]